MQAVRQRGAVLEAASPLPLGSPSVALLIEPDSSVRVVATMEQIFSPKYRVVGHSFPQVSVVHSALVDAATAVGAKLAEVSFVGAHSSMQ